MSSSVGYYTSTERKLGVSLFEESLRSRSVFFECNRRVNNDDNVSNNRILAVDLRIDNILFFLNCRYRDGYSNQNIELSLFEFK